MEIKKKTAGSALEKINRRINPVAVYRRRKHRKSLLEELERQKRDGRVTSLRFRWKDLTPDARKFFEKCTESDEIFREVQRARDAPSGKFNTFMGACLLMNVAVQVGMASRGGDFLKLYAISAILPAMSSSLLFKDGLTEAFKKSMLLKKKTDFFEEVYPVESRAGDRMMSKEINKKVEELNRISQNESPLDAMATILNPKTRLTRKARALLKKGTGWNLSGLVVAREYSSEGAPPNMLGIEVFLTRPYDPAQVKGG
jgi:hypothetical protein